MAQKSLEERIQRLEDIRQIQNLMGKYCYLHLAGLHDKQVELFAKKTPGVKAVIADWGVWEENEGIEKLYGKIHMLGDRVGAMSLHTLTTPVIEVAGDGKTAKGLWISPGCESHLVDGKPGAWWVWGKYGADFVKEDGEWKFWRTNVYGIFFTPYDKSWVEAPDRFPPPLSDELKPDHPSGYHWEYRTDIKTENIPAPPEPYETWDGKSMVATED